MATAEEKVRTSGESPREQSGPILPTVNPDTSADSAQPKKELIHPVFYVV